MSRSRGTPAAPPARGRCTQAGSWPPGLGTGARGQGEEARKGRFPTCAWREHRHSFVPGHACGRGGAKQHPTAAEAKAECAALGACCGGVTCAVDVFGRVSEIAPTLLRDAGVCPVPGHFAAGHIASATHMLAGPYGDVLLASGLPPLLLRKWWEFAAIIHTANVTGKLREGARGLCVGCGEEYLPAIFARRGMDVLATERPSAAGKKSGGGWGWSGDAPFLYPSLVSAEQYQHHVRTASLDMADPEPMVRQHRGSFDFVWSTSVVEHVGSMEKCMQFIVASLGLLKPGGVAIHVSEVNIDARNAEDTCAVEGSDFMLFTQGTLADLRRRVDAAGHSMGPLHLCVPSVGAEGRFDYPPYVGGETSLRDWPSARHMWPPWRNPHFKLHRCAGGHQSAFTSFSMVFRAGRGRWA